MIYPDERQRSFRKFYHNKETVNGVSLAEGQKLTVDNQPALIIKAWKDGMQTENLIAVCAKPYRHIPGYALAELMMETAIAIDPSTPDYRDVKIRVSTRQDDFDVMAYSNKLARKYETS